MTEEEKKILDLLKNIEINYERVEHPPVFTVEEAKRLCKVKGTGCKNLFLKEKGNKNYYLVIMPDHKRANFKSISKQLQISKLSFANEEELFEFLGLKPGEVTPFGLINDINKKVNVILDGDLGNSKFVSFHPNVNTSTLILTYKDFERYLEWCHNKVEIITI